ncbi:MAG: hypothetical protein IT231_15275 [Flavobacteriales bacterium]|nr:hypothetical protein [Flavobacteriales bacterium]MCC6656520.1 hypothetical protein [Flavobacteriales bacterium]HNE81681.1 hypothetical protein [Flavobacteriales bacterium]
MRNDQERAGGPRVKGHSAQPSAGGVLAERVNNAVGITEVPTDGLASGLYSVVLLADGLNVGSTKFEIIC